MTASIETGTIGKLCSSLSLIVSTSPTPGNGALPFWISVVGDASSSNAVITATPTPDVPNGTVLLLFVWANDELRNPGCNISIRTELSLRLSVTKSTTSANSSDHSEVALDVSTLATLLELSATLYLLSPSSASLQDQLPILICPEAASGAFCSYSSSLLSLGSFGTAEGVSSVLKKLRYALPPSYPAVFARNTFLKLKFTDAVNPTPLQFNVSLTLLVQYEGVRSAAPLPVLQAKIGRPFSVSLATLFAQRHRDHRGRGLLR